MLALPAPLRRLALAAPWISLSAYFVKAAMMDLPRHLSAYYPLLLPLLLIGAGQAVIVRRRWWRALVWGVMLLAVPVVVLVPGRPLWPAQTILSRLTAWKPNQRLLQRALTVYSVYNVRSDPLANVRALLPQGLKVVGFMGTADDIDISLWRPFGSRCQHSMNWMRKSSRTPLPVSFSMRVRSSLLKRVYWIQEGPDLLNQIRGNRTTYQWRGP